jgi:hypothetical protein
MIAGAGKSTMSAPMGATPIHDMADGLIRRVIGEETLSSNNAFNRCHSRDLFHHSQVGHLGPLMGHIGSFPLHVDITSGV